MKGSEQQTVDHRNPHSGRTAPHPRQEHAPENRFFADRRRQSQEDGSHAEEIDLALVSLGREAWEATLGMAARLRTKGVGCIVPLVERPMGAQLRRADRAGARFALFVGKEELAAGRYGLKDLRTGEQVDVEEVVVPARVQERRA